LEVSGVEATTDEQLTTRLRDAAEGLTLRAPDPNDPDWQGQWLALNSWIDGLRSDLQDAAKLVAHVKTGDSRAAKDLRVALWLIDAAFEKLGAVLVHALGVSSLEKDGGGVAFRPGGGVARNALKRRLRELRDDYPTAGTLLAIAKGIGGQRSTVYRNNLAHGLNNLTANPFLCPIEEVFVDDGGRELGSRRMYLVPKRPGHSGDWAAPSLFEDAISAAEEGLDKLREAVDAATSLIRDAGGCHPPQRIWATSDGRYHITKPEPRPDPT
jgi:hypothetical protein